MIIFNRQNIFHQNDYSVITTGPFFAVIMQPMQILLKKLR